MDFGHIIERSLQLARNHTVLWKLGLLAIFTEGMTGGFLSLPPFPGQKATPPEEAEAIRMFETGLAWVQANQLLTVLVVVIATLILVFAWYASLRAKAGLIATVVDLENGKSPGRFLEAYRRGAPFAWRLMGFYLTFGLLVSIVFGLPAAVFTTVASTMSEVAQWGLFILMIPAFFVVASYAHFIFKVAERAIVIEGERIWASIGSAHRVLLARPGLSALIVLVDAGIQILFVMLIAAIIIIAIGLAALLALILSAVLPNAILVAVVGAAIILSVGGLFLLAGWFASFTVSYWTLAYRALRYIINKKGN